MRRWMPRGPALFLTLFGAIVLGLAFARLGFGALLAGASFVLSCYAGWLLGYRPWEDR